MVLPDATQTQSATGGEALSHVARVFQLTVAASPLLPRARVVTLDQRRLIVGREPPETCRRLVLADAQASRSHAEVCCDPAEGFYTIRDLDSRNGLVVGGRKTDSARLAQGSVIRIGASLLVCSERLLAVGDPVVLSEWPTLRGMGLTMQRLRGEIQQAAPHPIPVLVLGETGTGKELVAREIHRLSGRSGPFVALNCAAIPEALAESELFGHAAGAFTGAVHRSDGYFASADGGTLFLDEVAELPPGVQAKLLRALATGEVRPLGRSDARQVDVRVIGATHRDIASAPDFRADLFARLAGWTLRVPPLRERREDVLWLARVFSERASPDVSLSTNAAEALLLYDWPRNVRELEMTIANACAKAGGGAGRIQCAHLPETISAPLAARVTPPRRSEPPLDFVVPPDKTPSSADLQIVLDRFEGNIARVAEYFGRDRKQIYRWLERAKESDRGE